MDTTATQIAYLEHTKFLSERAFMHQLSKFIRNNAQAKPLKNEYMPEYDIEIQIPLDGELSRLIEEHLPFIISLLPSEVAVVDRAILGTIAGAAQISDHNVATPFALDKSDIARVAEDTGRHRIESRSHQLRYQRENKRRAHEYQNRT